jgi:hypothetical protein
MEAIDVIMNPPKLVTKPLGTTMPIELTDGLKEAEKKLDAMELVVVCAADIVEAWPKMTMRTLSQMTVRMDTLRQALEALKK